MKKSAFTLIELLVVIAIIAILAAILFPVFAQAKLAAKKAADVSNVKNIGLAMILYTGDFDDTFPLGTSQVDDRTTGSGDDNFITWREIVAPYVKNGANSGTSRKGGLMGGGIWATPAASFAQGYNPHQTIVPTWDQVGWNGPIKLTVTTTQLRHPAGTLLLTTPGINGTDCRGKVCGLASSNEIGDQPWFYCGPKGAGKCGTTAGVNWAGDADQDSTDWFTQQVPRYRYSGQANIVFADGHVKSVAKPAFTWCKYLVLPEVGHGGGNTDDWNVTNAFNAGGLCTAAGISDN